MLWSLPQHIKHINFVTTGNYDFLHNQTPWVVHLLLVVIIEYWELFFIQLHAQKYFLSIPSFLAQERETQQETELTYSTLGSKHSATVHKYCSKYLHSNSHTAQVLCLTREWKTLGALCFPKFKYSISGRQRAGRWWPLGQLMVPKPDWEFIRVSKVGASKPGGRGHVLGEGRQLV